MSVFASSSLHALSAFAAWTMLHVVIILGRRSYLFTLGRAKATSFKPSRFNTSNDFIGMVSQSHFNCVENLPLLATAVLVNRLSSTGTSSVVDTLAWYVVYARIAQSLCHWYSTSNESVVTSSPSASCCSRSSTPVRPYRHHLVQDAVLIKKNEARKRKGGRKTAAKHPLSLLSLLS